MKSTQLSMRWIPVADASGRIHLEAVWMAEAAEVAVAPSPSTQAA